MRNGSGPRFDLREKVDHDLGLDRRIRARELDSRAATIPESGELGTRNDITTRACSLAHQNGSSQSELHDNVQQSRAKKVVDETLSNSSFANVRTCKVARKRHQNGVWLAQGEVATLGRFIVPLIASLLAVGCGGGSGGGGEVTTGTNQNPVVHPDAFIVTKNSTNNNLTVLANNGSGADSDPDGNPLTVTAVGATNQGGIAVVNATSDGVKYTPATGFTGTETFTYTIGDGQGGTASALVTVTINDAGSSQNPVAQPDAFSVNLNTINNNLAVLANNGNGVDADLDGNPLTVTAVGATDHGGTAVVNATSNGVTYTPANGFRGTETFSYTISDGQGGIATATATVTVGAMDTGGAFLPSGAQEIVSIEAEHYQVKTALSGHDWSLVTSPTGFSGTGAMSALPNNGANIRTNYAATSPRMDFNVQFATTGTNYVWVRGVGANGSDDSIHVGLDGQEIATSGGIPMPQGTSYGWNSSGFFFNVPTSGVHTVNVWMREDGVVVDKIVLTTDPTFVATGLGPTESTRASGCLVYPSVTIASPTAGYLQSATTLAVTTLTCLDAVLNNGWGVKFVLDDGFAGGGNELFDYSAPFEVSFPGVALAEHKVAAFVVTASGVVQAGDTETPVGVGGYSVAIGDSITHGDFDTADTTDNVSADGRDVGGGFEPVLNNLLTAELGYPNTVKNEGIGGITSAGGLAALPGVIAAHPQAQRFLVEYGMNDARPSLPVPSGLGLNPGNPGYPGTFKDNLQQIINLIHAAGKDVMIAKVGIALGDGATTTPPYPDPNQGARSLNIQQYNLVVDELVANPANNIAIVPPDFYAYFLAHYSTEYYDNIHPNSTGYQSMANLWFQAIVP